MKFCPDCGGRLRASRRGPSVCPSCGHQADAGRAGDDTLLGSFPYPSMRPFQREVLEQVESALSSGKRFIALEAPVGFGKSALAAALCNYLRSAYIVTSTKQLQEQYSADFGYTVVKGKPNFRCLVPTSTGAHLPCNKGRCEVDWKLSDCSHYLSFEQYDQHKKHQCTRNSKCEHLRRGELCPYYEQKWESFRAPVTVCNYPFFLSELRYADDLPHRRLLVCDEAHDLEKQLVSFASFSLRRSVVQMYHESIVGGGGTVQDVVIPDGGGDDPSAWLGALSEARRTLDEFCDIHVEDFEMQDKVATCKSTLDSLERFTKDLTSSPENWVVNGVRRSADGLVEEVVFQPIEVGAYAGPLFGTADATLLMSATIFSPSLLCRTLGMEEKEVQFVSVPKSIFPVENRPILALNVAQLSQASMATALESVARAVDQIMDRHASERGVIHTTSYQQVNYIMQHVSEASRARLVTTEGTFERSVLLAIHGSTDASVLISPSLYQGVDLKDDLSRFQVVVKVPYPDLSDRRTRIKLDRDRSWYDWQTALRLVQTYGRSVRSETDHAVTYVLDSNFTRFVNGHRELFPTYFLDALADPATVA
ncbi:MAG: helicase C-terminal domain-containing protein [Nitrososphaerales archaeon]|jgi:Rad3-related DNA helicase